jgi:hypothetical protein
MLCLLVDDGDDGDMDPLTTYIHRDIYSRTPSSSINDTL